MQILLIHTDHFSYQAREKTEFAEEGVDLSGSVENALVAFCAVESPDEEDPEGVAKAAAEEIAGTAGKLGTDRVVLYPYAHLSSDLAHQETAVAVLNMLEQEIRLSKIEVKRAPFGWYKAFNLSCRGHPLSELSKRIVPGEGVAKAGKREVTHEWFVLAPDGSRKEVEAFIDDSSFGSLIKKELGLPAPAGGEPIHVELMRGKELVDYEPRSDVGHLRWLPKGKLVRDLLADYVLAKVLAYGAYPVETPVMYDLDDRAIYEHAAKFGERQYRFRSGNRDMMLRFAACFGMFSIMHSMHISPNNLPLKMYELSTYSFRHEQKGEVIGLKRLRAFTMPDMHTLCRNMEEALECFEEQLAMGWQSGRDLDTTLVGVFRCTKDFYAEYSAWVQKIVQLSGVPMLVEILGERVHYWVAKVDLAAIDGQGRPIENPTVQIDVESSERFDISFVEGGRRIHPPILHCSPTGSIERVICALLENTSTQELPKLPTWLSPTQVRIVPIAERHMVFAEEVCRMLAKAGIRADIDDREESMNKKIRMAGSDWIPYVAVIGDQEMENHSLTVTIRGRSMKNRPYREHMSPERLCEVVLHEIAGKPVRPLYTPVKLSLKARYI
ncbi:MAG: threonine--tRNA ligase [Methanomicrobiales archaeon]|nr:threonine--tRNA ligase [Methanomicrobiales archaeon]